MAAGEAPRHHAAYLADRICGFEGRPQRYGTQFDWDDNGELSPLPLEDPERVNEFRQQVGLGPLDERIEQVRDEARADGEKPPQDIAAWREKQKAWARSVGWI